jgi:hypothetical protein
MKRPQLTLGFLFVVIARVGHATNSATTSVNQSKSRNNAAMKFQFSMSTLLLATTFAAITFGGILAYRQINAYGQPEQVTDGDRACRSTDCRMSVDGIPGSVSV